MWRIHSFQAIKEKENGKALHLSVYALQTLYFLLLSRYYFLAFLNAYGYTMLWKRFVR